MVSERQGSLTQNRRKYVDFFHASRCVHRPWDLFFIRPSRFMFFSISISGRGIKLQNWGTSEQHWCTSIPERVVSEHKIKTWSSTVSSYGSPTNFSLPESPVSKPGPSRISWNMVSLDTPTSTIDRPFFAQKKMYGYVISIVSFLVPRSHETSVKESR